MFYLLKKNRCRSIELNVFFLTHLIKAYPIIFFLTSNQITIGAPNTDVTALIGSVISPPGTCEILSQISTLAQSKIQNSIVWLLV
jgi:hypothetical protein